MSQFKLAQAYIEITGKDTGLARSVTAARKKVERDAEAMDRKLQSIGSGMSRAGNYMSLGVTLPGALVGRSWVAAAMDARESRDAMKSIFKGLSGDAVRWSDTFAARLNRNRYETRKFLTDYYRLLKGLGVEPNQAMGMAKQLVTRQYDASSLYNKQDVDTAGMIRSALKGEFDPIEELGVVLNEQVLKEEMKKLGGIGKEATTAAKAMAIFNRIMRDTADADKNLSQTIDSPANKAKTAAQRYGKVTTDFADKALPVVSEVMEVLTKILDLLDKIGPAGKTAFAWAYAGGLLAGPLLKAGGGILGGLANYKIWRAGGSLGGGIAGGVAKGAATKAAAKVATDTAASAAGSAVGTAAGGAAAGGVGGAAAARAAAKRAAQKAAQNVVPALPGAVAKGGGAGILARLLKLRGGFLGRFLGPLGLGVEALSAQSMYHKDKREGKLSDSPLWGKQDIPAIGGIAGAAMLNPLIGLGAGAAYGGIKIWDRAQRLKAQQRSKDISATYNKETVQTGRPTFGLVANEMFSKPTEQLTKDERLQAGREYARRARMWNASGRPGPDAQRRLGWNWQEGPTWHKRFPHLSQGPKPPVLQDLANSASTGSIEDMHRQGMLAGAQNQIMNITKKALKELEEIALNTRQMAEKPGGYQ